MGNINDSFFDGQYKDIWRAIIPAELTVKETAFMISYFNLGPRSRVLDMMCGYGRHAIALGEKGIEVTAIDNLGDYIEEIRKTAHERSLPVKAVKADAATYEPDELFDLALCMGNSLNFFPAADVERILSNTAKHLKKDGHFLINSWSLAEIAIPRFKEQSSGEVGGFKVESTSRHLHHPDRIETETVMTGPDGNAETKTAVDYIYSVTEMEEMLNKAGLSLVKNYSIPGKKEFALGDPRAYIIAGKN